MWDTIYGGDRAFRLWLEERRQLFVLAVPKNEPLWVEFQQVEAQTLAAAMSTDGWRR